MNMPPRVLIISGSDSGGGAGMQADIKSCLANGGFATSALTALTVQNTLGVHGVMGVAPEFVVAQISAVLDDIGCDAVKVGMLATADVVRAVAERLEREQLCVVVDPVMVTASGDSLIDDEAVEAVRELLLPLARLATPNRREAAKLLGLASPPSTIAECRNAARAIRERFGPRAVLLKGAEGGSTARRLEIGDCEGPVLVDILECEDGSWDIATPRLETRNTHGTGCTLASAIATHLADGKTLVESVVAAKKYLHDLLRASQTLNLGSGVYGPLDHGFRLRNLDPGREEGKNTAATTTPAAATKLSPCDAS